MAGPATPYATVSNAVIGVHEPQFVRSSCRQRSEEEGVDEAEDGGVDTDSERENENSDEGETRALREGPYAVAKVLPHWKCATPKVKQFALNGEPFVRSWDSWSHW